MIKTLKNLLKQDKERYTVPRKVQDVIPVRRIWKDGIFQVGGRFSKMHINTAGGHSDSMRDGFLGDIHHSGTSLVIDMCKRHKNLLPSIDMLKFDSCNIDHYS